MRLIAAFVLATMAGCVTTSAVVPATQGTYVISAANDACDNCESPQIRATRRASAYCEKLNRTMLAVDFEESGIDLGFGNRYTLTFSCVATAAAK